MSYTLNSLKVAYIGECYRVILGDTRSLDFSSCRGDDGMHRV